MSDLKLFRLTAGRAEELASGSVALERHLQRTIESNMETLFGVTFLESEYSRGPKHRGRIDSIGIDETGSPVIFEFKRSRAENVINQGLFYLDWLLALELLTSVSTTTPMLQRPSPTKPASSVEPTVVDYLAKAPDELKNVHLRSRALLVCLKVNPESVDLESGFSRDVRGIGHFGTDVLELRITNSADPIKAEPYLRMSYGAS